MSAMSRTFLGTTLLAAGHGGIACVARMTAKTLIDHGDNPTILSLLDDYPVKIAGSEAATARGSRLNYIARCHVAAFSHDRFLYDSVGTARAHPRLPGLRRPYGVWIHGVEVWNGLGADRERALRGADFVLVNSHFTLKKFQDIHGPLKNARVCWLATEEDEPPQKSPMFDGPPTVLILARADAGEMYKGHRELIESWPDVMAAIPDARLVIAGSGSGLGEMKDLASRSAAAENIEIKGFVAESDMADLWCSAHIFAMPSRGEGFGLVYIEAMRHGLPVIASIHDAGQEINIDGQTGYNVDLDQPEQLAERIISLFENTKEARKFGQAGYELWKQNFRFTAFKQRLIESLPV